MIYNATTSLLSLSLSVGCSGLRAGSELLSINSFAQKSEMINLLHSQYPDQRQHQFIWMYNFRLFTSLTLSLSLLHMLN